MKVSLAWLPGGGKEITNCGKILNRYVIEASPDLMAWTQLALLTNTTGTIRYTDPAANGQQRRFYRVLSVP